MRQWLGKALLLVLLACSPFVVATAAFAEKGALTGTEPTADAVQTPIQTLESAKITDENEGKPSLGQGNFFYSMKIIAEGIRLAIETNVLERPASVVKNEQKRAEKAEQTANREQKRITNMKNTANIKEKIKNRIGGNGHFS